MPVDLLQVEKDGRTFRVAYKKGILVSAAPIAHSNASTHTSLPPSLTGYKYVFSISKATYCCVESGWPRKRRATGRTTFVAASEEATASSYWLEGGQLRGRRSKEKGASYEADSS
jgi:hypothetical protein